MRGLSKEIWLGLTLCGVIASMVTYARGNPLVVPAVLLFLVPAVWLTGFAFGGGRPRVLVLWSRLRSYRALILIYGIVALAAVREMQRKPAEVYGNPDSNYPGTMETLYPDRPETEYDLGRDAEMALMHGSLDVERIRRKFAIAAGHYERAISRGVKSNEDLLYNYALALMKMEADPTKIDTAIADWKRNFPRSKRRSLDERRRKIADQIENLKRFEASRPDRVP